MTCMYRALTLLPPEADGSRYQVPAPWFQIPGPWLLLAGARFLLPGSMFLVPGSRYLVRGSWSLVLGSWSQVPATWFLVPGSSAQVCDSRVVCSQLDDGRKFQVRMRFDTDVELTYFLHGGILNYMIRKMALS